MLDARSHTNLRAPFWVEMTLLVTVKLILLGLIWQLWFSQPIAVHMHMPSDQVERHLLGAPSATPSTSIPSGQPS